MTYCNGSTFVRMNSSAQSIFSWNSGSVEKSHTVVLVLSADHATPQHRLFCFLPVAHGDAQPREGRRRILELDSPAQVLRCPGEPGHSTGDIGTIRAIQEQLFRQHLSQLPRARLVEIACAVDDEANVPCGDLAWRLYEPRDLDAQPAPLCVRAPKHRRHPAVPEAGENNGQLREPQEDAVEDQARDAGHGDLR